MPSDKDIVEEAQELADLSAEMKEWWSQRQIRTEAVLRALADEVERLRDQFAKGRRAFKNNDAEWWQQFED